eukprot:4159677-Prymnesium_polylepis.1
MGGHTQWVTCAACNTGGARLHPPRCTQYILHPATAAVTATARAASAAAPCGCAAAASAAAASTAGWCAPLDLQLCQAAWARSTEHGIGPAAGPRVFSEGHARHTGLRDVRGVSPIDGKRTLRSHCRDNLTASRDFTLARTWRVVAHVEQWHEALLAPTRQLEADRPRPEGRVRPHERVPVEGRGREGRRPPRLQHAHDDSLVQALEGVALLARLVEQRGALQRRKLVHRPRQRQRRRKLGRRRQAREVGGPRAGVAERAGVDEENKHERAVVEHAATACAAACLTQRRADRRLGERVGSAQK